MRLNLSIALALCAASVNSQGINFGGAPATTTTTTTEDPVAIRGGLLAPDLGLNPLGEDTAGGRNSAGGNCCCVRNNQNCPIPSGGGSGTDIIDIIDPRGQGLPDDAIGTRIVNNPPSEPLQSCPSGTRACCYNTQSQLDSVRAFCRSYPGQTTETWRQGCLNEGRNVGGPIQGNQCGERFPRNDVPVGKGEARPYEFPWTCLVLKGNNDFVGTCAIVPDNRDNDISRGTDRVITATHKLKNIKGGDELKVRIIEYDASGQSPKESSIHKEFVVDTIRNHKNYNPRRLSHDVTILFLTQRINLRNDQHVNAACLPRCGNMFTDFQYNNGTGVRCWVAGWGKDSPTGNFNFIQNKVDVPLVDFDTCDRVMRRETGRSSFRLSRSEICAGGQEAKDACEGDGGAPLVCQSKLGRWYVVGLVTWGVGCGKAGVPGVYANVHNMLDFIVSPPPSFSGGRSGIKIE